MTVLDRPTVNHRDTVEHAPIERDTFERDTGQRDTVSDRGHSDAWYWHVPTAVVAGAGALGSCAPLVRSHGERALLVTDPAVRAGSELVERCCRSLAAAGVAVTVADTLAGAPTLQTVRWLLARQRQCGAQSIVAVGGGSVIDPAKVAAAAARHPELMDEDLWTGGGLVEPVLTSGRRSTPLVAVPTTVGTGTEVSPSASILVGTAKKLLVHQAIRPAVAVLDPQATATTPRTLVLEGAFEAFLRTIGQHVTDDRSQPVQDALTIGLARQILAGGDLVCARTGEPAPDEVAVRHHLALASASTHTGWMLCGRDRFAHRLWYLANEWAPALGVSKIVATAALAVPYFAALEADQIPGSSGLTHAGTVATALFGPGRRLSEWVAELLARWHLGRTLTDLGADRELAGDVARRTWAAWGPPSPALTGFEPEHITRLHEAAFESSSHFSTTQFSTTKTQRGGEYT